MTAHSELFVTEIVRDCVMKELEKADGDIEIPPEWRDIWDDAKYPDKGTARVLGENDKVVGYLDWDVEFNIVKNPIGGDRYIEASPKNVKFRKVKK